jgi:hypothetical protein
MPMRRARAGIPHLCGQPRARSFRCIECPMLMQKGCSKLVTTSTPMPELPRRHSTPHHGMMLRACFCFSFVLSSQM